MSEGVAELNHLLAIGTIAMQLAVVFGALFVFTPDASISRQVLSYVKKYALQFGFFLVLGSSILTLVYSDYFGFIPCSWCWFQRVALYPQIILLGLAWWKNDKNVWRYIIALSIAGLIVALYQHYLQMGGSALVPCPASGEGDCGQRFIFEFGYITFPLMSATIFAFQALLGYIAGKR